MHCEVTIYNSLLVFLCFSMPRLLVDSYSSCRTLPEYPPVPEPPWLLLRSPYNTSTIQCLTPIEPWPWARHCAEDTDMFLH